MLQNKKIAFFIDVDNVGLSSADYANVMDQLNGMGKILYGKIYGAGERKHKEIYEDAAAHCYDTDRQMRVKRRGKRDFDNRIFVDVVDSVAKAPAVDAVCIVAQPTDLVYLYSYLRRRGIAVIALDNVDEICHDFIDEVIDLDKVAQPKPAKAKPQKAAPVKKAEPTPKAEPVKKAAPTKSDDVDSMEQLLRTIARLSAENEEPAPVKKQPKVEQPVQEPVQEPVEKKVAPTSAPVEESAPAKRPAQYSPQSSNDLIRQIRQIEELRQSNRGDSDEELLDKIREILDMED